MNSIDSAFILAGGKGERLKPLTDKIPKSLVEVQEKPLLQWNIENLKMHGIKIIVLGVGHRAKQIKDFFGDGEKFGVEIYYSEEQDFMGTAGALKLAEEFFAKKFIVTNADEMKNVDYSLLEIVHEENNAFSTIALKQVEDVSQFGVVELEGNRIKSFVEKPSKEEAKSNLVNAGAYLFEPDVFELIPEFTKLSIEKDIFPKIVAQNELFGVEFEGQWFPTDTPERLKKATTEWNGFR